jgi:hypothetical protein
MAEDNILVGVIDDDGRLRTLRIPRTTAHTAREHGWMVFEDFETLITPEAATHDEDDDE